MDQIMLMITHCYVTELGLQSRFVSSVSSFSFYHAMVWTYCIIAIQKRHFWETMRFSHYHKTVFSHDFI